MRSFVRMCLLAALVSGVHGAIVPIATIAGPNCGGRTFVLELQDDIEHEGSFTRLRIQTPGMPEFTLNSPGGWVAYEGESEYPLLPKTVTKRYQNLVRSKYLYCASIPAGKGRRTLVFVTGYPYGCCLPSIDVIAIDSNREPVVILHEDDFRLHDILDSDKNGEFELVSWLSLSEGLGENEATYNPFYVFTLSPAPKAATYSLELSRRYNLKNYCWFDPSDKRDHQVILTPQGDCKPVIEPPSDGTPPTEKSKAKAK